MKQKIFRNVVVVVVFIVLTVPLLSPGQKTTQPTPQANQDTPNQVTYRMTFSEDDLSFDTILGYDRVQLKEGGYLNDIGKPMMPIKEITIALPQDMKVTHVQVVDVQRRAIEGTYSIVPAQPPRTINDDQPIPFTDPDTTIYVSDQLYPSSVAEYLGHTDLAGQVMARIRLSPVQYLPSEKTVFFCTSLTLVISGTDGYMCGDYLSQSLSAGNRDMYESMVKDMVINPGDVQLHRSTVPQHTGVAPGDYDYVIITKSDWVSAFQPLADWKTKKGVPATIVTTTWIYNNGGYGGSNVEKIKAFVQDAYTNWGTIYVLLGGDIDTVPCHYRTFPSVDSDSVANDAYYADFDADWTCEVNVGRASVTGTGTGVGGIGNFINKIMAYEKNPPLTNYAKKVALFGFNLDQGGGTPAELCKEVYINDTYIPDNWTVRTVYDSHDTRHKTSVIIAVGNGQNLINHADHSSANFMGTGYVDHDWGLSSSDVDAFHNGNKQSIWYSMGCDPAAYDQSNCIAEHYVRDADGGGVAFVGNSRYGWYYHNSYDTLSMGYDISFFRSLFNHHHYKLGSCFSDHKNDAYQNDAYYQYIYTELTLLGDPELPIWTENPINLSVSYQAELLVGSSTFTVHVTSNGNPVNQAYVCLWKGTEVYLTGYTNTNGDVVFTPSPSTTGTMYVTVTKHNYLPYEGCATVILSILHGDANNDGVIDAGDVVYLINYLYKNAPAPLPLVIAGDCNGDALVNVADVVYLINYLYRNGPAPIN